MRPATLSAVAELALAGQSFDASLANFLDGFYLAPTAHALLRKPPLLASRHGDMGRIEDAYLAATAEELARKFDLPSPPWIDEDSRKLHRPWFASSLSGLRAVLLLESPAGFRSRNLFVSENALSRA